MTAPRSAPPAAASASARAPHRAASGSPKTLTLHGLAHAAPQPHRVPSMRPLPLTGLSKPGARALYP